MSHLKRLTVILCIVAGFTAAAQQSEVILPKAIFKVAPQNFTQNELKVGTEFFLRGDKSLSLSIYGRYNNSNDLVQNEYYPGDYYTGFGSEIAYRKYISPFKVYETKRGKSYLQGIYVSGYLQGGKFFSEGKYRTYIVDPDTGFPIMTSIQMREDVRNAGVGFTIGVQRTLWKVVFIDAYIGGGMQFSDIDFNNPIPQHFFYYTDIAQPSYAGIMPKFGLLVGVRL